MVRWGLIVVFLVLAGLPAMADTLHFKDGRALSGELAGIGDAGLVFRVDGVSTVYPFAAVARVDIDWQGNPEPRLTKAKWQRAMAKAQRALFACRSARYGLMLGGFLFMGGGYWLSLEGYGPFGNLLTALGAVATVLGVVAPPSECPAQEAQVKLLARIGLDHDWVY
ncbi:MAG: hypothetical protein NUV94_01040 [Candidatus Acetothermia bacterium]|jgi:hypothetical protein|nr:hypothetical protein [Candidatus Acetothermia bacterium]